METSLIKPRPGRIGIDFHVASGIYQGVRTYLTNLIDSMLKLRSELDYFIYARNLEELSHWEKNNTNVTLKKLPGASGRFNLLMGFPFCAIRDNLSLFHSQYVLPLLMPCKSVLTIHDILFESHPEFFPETHRRLLKFFIPFSAKRANRIISVSEFTKKEIIKYYRVPEEKITVIYEGASDRFAPINDRDMIVSVVQKHGIKKKYVLFVGRIEPRKNIVGLLHAFVHIRNKGMKDYCIVIVGNQDKIFQENELFNKIKELNLESDVIFTGGVSEEDLPVLYNGAEVLVYPAFAEGFGLPVLEAMSCGTPVITSNTTSLPEVTADAAILINPHSSGEIGQAMEKILSDPALRREYASRGLQRAKTFSWADAAKKTIEVYKEVLKV
jgi:glycosyltransferase involved in cell wall biosynthesis